MPPDDAAPLLPDDALDEGSSERIRITADDVRDVVPAPLTNRRVAPPPSDPPPVGRSKLAVASFVIALVGIPLAGCLLGPIAAFAGAVALGSIHNHGLKGFNLAVAGIVLGVLEAVAWAAVLMAVWSSGVDPGAVVGDGGADDGHVPALLSNAPSELEIDQAREPIRSALRANVTITRRITGGVSTGSGVIVGSSGATWFVVTNRHVAGDDVGGDDLVVTFCNGEEVAGTLRWLAPTQVDVAVVSARPTRTEALKVMPLVSGARASIGDEAFAIGNPLNYEATYTTGVISSIRSLLAGRKKLRVYQTQAPVNHGNSGGGLYSEAGRLIGINTWTTEKRLSEGLGFAIAVDGIVDLLEADGPPWLEAVTEEGE